jgi:hypothetical protein
MTVTISGTTGIDKVVDGSIGQADLAANVVGNGPVFSASAPTSNQSVTSGVATKVALTRELFDTANAFDSTTNSRFQPTVAGYYQVNGRVRGGASSGLTLVLAVIRKNGSDYSIGNVTQYSAAAPADITSNVSDIVFLNGTTDYVELWGTVAGTSPYFSYPAVDYAACMLSGFLARAA